MVTPSWHPDLYARRRPHLEVRQKVIRAIRRYFEEQNFAEVDTPALQFSPGNEVHLQAFKTELRHPHGETPTTLYLHTSPEFAMKKLLVAGEHRLYQIAHVYRNGERSSRHHPEFSMMEWYRANADTA
ncbi:MAG TPA: EF-P lysine aminoacylase GenX, partial [Rhodospirillaceae bacterium]|nr:EF-P lysine aminoacylase GenX [Rhodospirillaceae bacterium]